MKNRSHERAAWRDTFSVCAWIAILAMALASVFLAGCMEPKTGPAPDREESALAAEIRVAGVDRQAAANYADLFEGMAALCASPAVTTTEDLKRAEVNGREVLGQAHSERLAPIAQREFACLAQPAPLNEALRTECRQA
ncbi:MAG TPA: hypothetical protein VHB77_12010, partial [Planctomycetaceae bacterium]|nr:hypothetical protein [Planctomycetaceae bacterium]